VEKVTDDYRNPIIGLVGELEAIDVLLVAALDPVAYLIRTAEVIVGNKPVHLCEVLVCTVETQPRGGDGVDQSPALAEHPKDGHYAVS
jgi:hypothetical protein